MECPHMISGVSLAGIRKRLRTKPTVITCHPCTFKAFTDSNEYWICLQCGNVACGDSNAQDGDAKKHYDVPRSDDHGLVLHLEKDSRCWCYRCNKEIDSRSGHLRDIIQLIKRNFKHGNQRQITNNSNSSKPVDEETRNQEQKRCTTTIAIPLPPPSPVSSSLIGAEGPKKKSKKDRKVERERSGSRGQLATKNRPAGLTNIGNTCFMNSALQCLASTRLLLPKLDIFGAGHPIRVILSQAQDEASVIVLPEREPENENCIDDKESGIGSIASEDQDLESEMPKPLQITLQISPESMTGRLREAFNYIRKSPDDTNGPTTSYGWRSFTPTEIQSLLVKQFRRGQQHDSHELLRTILDLMKKDQTKAFRLALMNHYGIANNKTERENSNSDPNLLELVKSLDQKVKHKTFVDEIFGGELVTTQTCLKCHFVKRSHEQFLDLSLPIRVIKHNDSDDTAAVEEKPLSQKPFKRFSLFDQQHNIVINKTLNDCLRCFTEPELLTGSNEVECENCHRMKQESESVSTIANPIDEEIENEFVVISSAEGIAEPEPIGIEPAPTNLMSELSVLKLENEDGDGAVSDPDFDLPPAQDGIGGSPSESEDESQSSSRGFPVPSYLNLPTYDKFESYQYQAGGVDCPLEDDPMLEMVVGDGPLIVPEATTVSGSGSTKVKASASADDEGYSEGENSTAAGNLENESGKCSGVGGPSESSSRNSISDPDENLVLKSHSDGSEILEEKKSKKGPKTSPKPTITKCPCSRQQTISRPPEALTIHLKRFQMTLGGLPQKLNDTVTFPILLDLTSYCCPQSQELFDEDGEVVYSLYGIVEHSGSINWGHYVAYVKTGTVEEENEEWWNISDSCVDSSTEKRVLDQEAYILFYERIRGAEKSKRKQAAIAATLKVEEDCSIWKCWDSNSGTQYIKAQSPPPPPPPPMALSWDYPTVSIIENPEPQVPTAPPKVEDDDDDIPPLEPITGSDEPEALVSNWYSMDNNRVPLRIPRVAIHPTENETKANEMEGQHSYEFENHPKSNADDVYANSKIEVGDGDAPPYEFEAGGTSSPEPLNEILQDDIDLL